MGKDGLGKKLMVAAAALGAILLVLRVVGGRGGKRNSEAGIDRVDTGRSGEDRSGESVETGLERVSTSDADDDETAGDAADAAVDEDDADDSGSDEVAVEATGGRFDDLDLFDYVAIAGAAFEAAREEYRNRV